MKAKMSIFAKAREGFHFCKNDHFRFILDLIFEFIFEKWFENEVKNEPKMSQKWLP